MAKVIASRNILERNAVHITGQGTRLVLVHGFGCDQSMWENLVASLGEGYEVIRYDLTGMGDSDSTAYDTQRHGRLQGHADDLIQVLEAVPGSPVVAICHSVSAMIATLAANKRPDLFHALVMIGPSPRYINDGDYIGGFNESDIQDLLNSMDQNYLGFSGQLAGLVAGPDHPEARAILNQRFCRNDPLIAKNFARVTFLGDNRPDLDAVCVPTLIIQSARDVIAGPAVGAYVHAHIRNSKLIVLDSTGHSPHMTAPDQTAEAVRTFLAGLGV